MATSTATPAKKAAKRTVKKAAPRTPEAAQARAAVVAKPESSEWKFSPDGTATYRPGNGVTYTLGHPLYAQVKKLSTAARRARENDMRDRAELLNLQGELTDAVDSRDPEAMIDLGQRFEALENSINERFLDWFELVFAELEESGKPFPRDDVSYDHVVNGGTRMTEVEACWRLPFLSVQEPAAR